MTAHWLLFDKARQVVGCGCGFRADIEDDSGHGDSVVKHLSADAWADGWNARACGEFYDTNPHRDAMHTRITYTNHAPGVISLNGTYNAREIAP